MSCKKKTAKLCSFYPFCAWFLFIKGDVAWGDLNHRDDLHHSIKI